MQYINVKVESKKEGDEFSRFCKSKGISKKKRSTPPTYPHFRIILIETSGNLKKRTVVETHNDESWNEGPFTKGIHLNHGPILSVEEAINMYDGIVKKMEERVV